MWWQVKVASSSSSRGYWVGCWRVPDKTPFPSPNFLSCCLFCSLKLNSTYMNSSNEDDHPPILPPIRESASQVAGGPPLTLPPIQTSHSRTDVTLVSFCCSPYCSETQILILLFFCTKKPITICTSLLQDMERLKVNWNFTTEQERQTQFDHLSERAFELLRTLQRCEEVTVKTRCRKSFKCLNTESGLRFSATIIRWYGELVICKIQALLDKRIEGAVYGEGFLEYFFAFFAQLY